MTLRILLTQQELCSSRTLFNLVQHPKRNLGCAILVAAIDDYKSMDEQAHVSAALFLYPASPEYREHYEWAVALAEGVNPGWLRSALDKARKVWDEERAAEKLRARFASALRKADSQSAVTPLRELENRKPENQLIDPRDLTYIAGSSGESSVPGMTSGFTEFR